MGSKSTAGSAQALGHCNERNQTRHHRSVVSKAWFAYLPIYRPLSEIAIERGKLAATPPQAHTKPERIVLVNPRPAGGGGVWTPPPLRFFEDSEKNGGAQRRRVFTHLTPPSFPQLLWKFRPNAIWGQVTRSGQVTQLQNNFPIAPRLQCFRESYETFRIWWAHQCLQNVYLGFLISVTSGQVIFATSPL